MLVEFLEKCGIENPIVCSSINKVGHAMNPNKDIYEKTIHNKKFRPIAMSILASGAINAKEAVKYVCEMPNIEGIVFGASSKQHIVETVELIKKYSLKEYS
jgi:phosphoribosylformimino-5-aminoimidazole carboxamide ribonucleotide (ProFAR) isomerase